MAKVTIVSERKGACLRLRWVVQGKKKSISLGLPDTKENRIKASEAARIIEVDLKTNHYDVTLNKYRKLLDLKVNVSTKTSLTPFNLVKEFAKYKLEVGLISESTYITDYTSLVNYIKLKGEDTDVLTLVDTIFTDKNSHTGKRFLNQIKAAYSWAVMRGKTEINPVQSLYYPKKLEKLNAQYKGEIKPFTRKERDLVIEAFENHKHYHFYSTLIKFLFLTGARPGEAIALELKHIRNKEILFEQSVSRTLKGKRITPKTKTNKFRVFKINSQLREVIDEALLRQSLSGKTTLLFPGPKGGLINVGNLNERAWKGVIRSLPIENRTLYSTRATFATMCLEAGMQKDVLAMRMGTSVEMLDQHYINLSKSSIEIPEL
jgi:integrase